jgi:hypothetical protein
MDDVGIFYGRFVYFATIWYILWTLGIFFPFLVCCAKKNLATLMHVQTYVPIIETASILP